LRFRRCCIDRQTAADAETVCRSFYFLSEAAATTSNVPPPNLFYFLAAVWTVRFVAQNVPNCFAAVKAFAFGKPIIDKAPEYPN
ncbi:MAG: hypothetical protein LUC21_06275, partial [Oscillospiraceae bacterium]|nr:hypothetical protein [Oscillospiraceae bacterium]